MAENNEARERILAASVKTFAEKGFDGARMDAIAKEAGVNKALIYYYFKSKKELLDTLVSDFLVQSEELILHLIRDFDFRGNQNSAEIFEQVFHYLAEHEDIIRLIMLETLKKESSQTFLFDFVNLYLGEDSRAYQMMKDHPDKPVSDSTDMEQARVTEFFTLLGPVLLYILLKDDWMKFYQMDKNQLAMQFVAALRETHIQHHQRHLD